MLVFVQICLVVEIGKVSMEIDKELMEIYKELMEIDTELMEIHEELMEKMVVVSLGWTEQKTAIYFLLNLSNP